MVNKSIQILLFELTNGIKSRSFLLTTILPPLFMALIMIIKPDDNTISNISVIDTTGLEISINENTRFNFTYIQNEHTSVDSLLEEENQDCVILIEHDAGEFFTTLYSKKQISSFTSDLLEVLFNNAIISSSLQDNAKEIVDNISSHFHFIVHSTDDSKGFKFIFVLVAIVLIYFIIFQFSGNIMKSISNEKNNRVIELLLSSTSPNNILFSKIIAGFILTIIQVSSWLIIMLFITSFFPIMDIPVSGIRLIEETVSIQDRLILISISCILIIGGYFQYAALFSIIGAISNDNTDSQQFSFVITMPLLITFIYIIPQLGCNPPIINILAIFPLTSPIALLAKSLADFNLPITIISITVLFLSAFGCLRIASIYYKRGIIDTNSRITFNTLFKWIRER